MRGCESMKTDTLCMLCDVMCSVNQHDLSQSHCLTGCGLRVYTVPAMKNQHELEEPILGQLQGVEKKQAYHVYAYQWGYAP